MAKIGQVQHFNKPLEDGMGFSAIVHANGLLHLAGIISVDEAANVVAPGDMTGQIDRIYDIMEETLAKNGATLAHVVAEVMYTTDMGELMQAWGTERVFWGSDSLPDYVRQTDGAWPLADADWSVVASHDGRRFLGS